MEDPKRILVPLSKEELDIIVYSLSSSQPINGAYENLQFKLYHRLLAKLNEVEKK